VIPGRIKGGKHDQELRSPYGRRYDLVDLSFALMGISLAFQNICYRLKYEIRRRLTSVEFERCGSIIKPINGGASSIWVGSFPLACFVEAGGPKQDDPFLVNPAQQTRHPGDNENSDPNI